MNVKMEKHKTSYYYDRHTKAIIEQGMKAYYDRYGQNITLTKFIDTCIKEAVKILPMAITNLTADKNTLIKKNLNQQNEIDKMHQLLRQLQRNNNDRVALNEAVNECLNKV